MVQVLILLDNSSILNLKKEKKEKINRRGEKKEEKACLSVACSSNYICHTWINICFKPMMIFSKQTTIWLPSYWSNGL